MKLAEKIIQIRKENNLTQEGLADTLHVSRQTVSNWETSKCYPDIETLILISDKFNISLDILLRENKEMIKAIDSKLKRNGILKIVILILSLVVIFIGGLFIAKRYTFNYAHEYIFNDNIDKEEITRSEDNLIMTIKKFNPNCVNVLLEIYNDGTYKIYDTNIIPDADNINAILMWDDPKTFTYKYDVLDILKNMPKRNKGEYEIQLGNGEVYTTDSNNKALMDFLKQENIYLDKCGNTIKREIKNGLYHLLNNIYSDEINPKFVHEGEIVSIANFLSKSNCTYQCIFNYQEPIEIKENKKIYQYQVLDDDYYLIECNNIIISKDQEKLIEYCKKTDTTF